MDSQTLEARIKDVIGKLLPYYKSEQYGPIHYEEGRFLQILVEITNAKSVLEIGASMGFSSLCMALGLIKTGGKLITIEIDPERARFAIKNFEEAGVNHFITLLKADAFTIIPTLKEKFDFIFLDATKKEYASFLKICIPLLKDGGLIVSHDTLSNAGDVTDYMDTVNNHPDLETVTVSTGDLHTGMTISYKKIYKIGPNG